MIERIQIVEMWIQFDWNENINKILTEFNIIFSPIYLMHGNTINWSLNTKMPLKIDENP